MFFSSLFPWWAPVQNILKLYSFRGFFSCWLNTIIQQFHCFISINVFIYDINILYMKTGNCWRKFSTGLTGNRWAEIHQSAKMRLKISFGCKCMQKLVIKKKKLNVWYLHWAAFKCNMQVLVSRAQVNEGHFLSLSNELLPVMTHFLNLSLNLLK